MQNISKASLYQRLSLCINLCKVEGKPVTGCEEPGPGSTVNRISEGGSQESHRISEGGSAKPQTVTAGAGEEPFSGRSLQPGATFPVVNGASFPLGDLKTGPLQLYTEADEQYARLRPFLGRIIELDIAFRSVTAERLQTTAWLQLQAPPPGEVAQYIFTVGEVVLVNSALSLLSEIAAELRGDKPELPQAPAAPPIANQPTPPPAPSASTSTAARPGTKPTAAATPRRPHGRG